MGFERGGLERFGQGKQAGLVQGVGHGVGARNKTAPLKAPSGGKVGEWRILFEALAMGSGGERGASAHLEVPST